MNGDILADDVAIANLDRAAGAMLETQILG